MITGGVAFMFWAQLLADLFGILVIAVAGGFLIHICWRTKVEGRNAVGRRRQRRARIVAASILTGAMLLFAIVQTLVHAKPWIATPPKVVHIVASAQPANYLPGETQPKWRPGMTDLRVTIFNAEAEEAVKLDLLLTVLPLLPSPTKSLIFDAAQTTKIPCVVQLNPGSFIHRPEAFGRRDGGEWKPLEVNIHDNNLRLICERLYGYSQIDLALSIFGARPESVVTKGAYETKGAAGSIGFTARIAWSSSTPRFP